MFDLNSLLLLFLLSYSIAPFPHSTFLHHAGLYKYNLDIYRAFMNLFDAMPIAALIGERRFFCVHGGLSPQLKKVFYYFFFTHFLIYCFVNLSMLMH